MRLDKFLANSGIGTRKEVKDIIKKGNIRVNNAIIKSNDFDVDEKKDVVTFNNEVVNYTKYRYIMLNKPKGVVSATEDNIYKTVIDLITDFKTYKLFPVGRLDIDTEGLLLITNDGKLSHNLLSPKKHVMKKYYVELESSLSDEDISKLEKGVYILDDYLTKEAKIEKIEDKKVFINISEGKFHQVKEMFLAVGNKVKYLKRVQMGTLKLDESLKLGAYRELTSEELKGLL